MARRKKKKLRKEIQKTVAQELKKAAKLNLHPDTKKSITALVFLCVAALFVLSAVEKAGPAGNFLHTFFDYILGAGYFALPLLLTVAALIFFFSVRVHPRAVVAGGLLILISGLGMVDIIESGRGGLLGALGGLTEKPFGFSAALLVNACMLLAGILITFNIPLTLPSLGKRKELDAAVSEAAIDIPVAMGGESGEGGKSKSQSVDDAASSPQVREGGKSQGVDREAEEKEGGGGRRPSGKEKEASQEGFHFSSHGKKYNPPPLSLLEDASEKPSSGDIKANANIIRRTLASFNIPVEMTEVHVGPKVTRFSLRPAEGVKLSRILALQNDLSLALAAHPIRIEAPIPGKSLVGIEVPNKASALVRLKHLMSLDVFAKSGPLAVALGKNVSGDPVVADIAKAPHMLIAGSSGAGKSVTIHSLLVSLLYKNSPETLRLILIDPKRVELTPYNDLPHMATSVITDPKKAILALKFAIKEMDDRYNALMEKRSRDIFSYNKKCIEKGEPILPFIVIVIDELADLMAAHPREIEGAIVRLAQMARATGIHLVVSTQRPSVEVVTGLIKANITSRIALQVASQVDSRTILDAAGAEKLLGGGDMLFISGELSKPVRIQGAFLTEKEVKKVVDHIRAHNGVNEDEVDLDGEVSPQRGMVDLDEFTEEAEDELYGDAVALVAKEGKASASMLQRYLRIGYARAARLLDIMEDNGVIGPADGAKPRDVYVGNDEEDALESDPDDDGEDFLN